MPSPPFPPRPTPSCQDDPYGSGRGHPRAPPNTPVRPQPLPNDSPRILRSILRPTPSYIFTPHDPTANPQIPRPQPLIPRSTTTSSYHHQHTSSSPELRPTVDDAWAPRVRPYPQQYPPDLPLTRDALSPSDPSRIVQSPRVGQDDALQRRSEFAARVNPHFVPGIRGRSASDVRIAHTPPPDLDPDRLARACGQQALTSGYPHNDQSRQGISVDLSLSRLKDSGTVRNTDPSPSHPPLPKIRVGHMYRRLDALARRSGRRAMDYVGFEDVVVIHKRDNQLREQLRLKRSERLREKDLSFHAIGAPLEDVLLYASTTIVIGNYQYYLPIVVVACIEELTKTGIYQSGLFRALPSRDRHLQLIDLFNKSPDFGANFNMRGQTTPDICALLSTFISSLPMPLLDAQIYAALWHWSVKLSVKREDARRDQQEEEEEERRARGEPPHPNSWMARTDLCPDDADSALETDQICIAQILLRFLSSANLSLFVYLCGFFTQLPLCPENGLQLEDVARIFGHRLLGGSIKVVSQRMMLWLLTRWHRISETLFGDMCGMAPPPPDAPPSQESALVCDGDTEQIEKGKGKRESRSDDALRYTMSSSSSRSSPSPPSPEDRRMSSRKSSSDGEEQGESSGERRRRKKRGLDTKQPHANTQVGRPPSTRKESHRRGHRGSGSRRNHSRHLSEPMDAPTSPDPFSIAFAKAQQDLAYAPISTTPGDESRESRSRFGASILPHQDTPVRVDRYETDSRPTNVDFHALLRETAVMSDVARTLVERVEVLERALQVRHTGGQVVRPFLQHLDGKDECGSGDGDGGEDRQGDDDKDTQDGLRVRLRLVEAERDKAQQVVRDVREYLLDEGSTLQQG